MLSRAAVFLSVSLLPIGFALAQEKVTYQDHIRPIFSTSCAGCHNPDKNTAGLNLTSYQGAISGSSNGKVLSAGDPDGSKLYLLVTHQQEPKMPQRASKLPDKQLELIRKWIAGGLLETSSSVALAPSKPKMEMTIAPTAGRPKGEPPMPKGLPLEPIVRAERSAAPGAMAASPWAPLVALSGPHQVLLYHTQTRDLLGVLPFAEGLPKALNFSRSGGLLIAGGGVGGETGKVAVYDVVTGRRITDVGDDYDEILAADITPDQSMIALGGPTKVLNVYEVASGKLLHEMEKHTDWILSIAYSPDGVLLASADRNGGLQVWEALSGNEFYTLPGHKAAVTALRFRADSNVLASASEDGTVKLWDMNSGAQIKSWPAHGSGVLSLDFAPDGRLVTAGRDRQVRVWSADGNKLRDLKAMGDIAVHAVFANEGKLVAAADFSGDVRLSDAADGKPAGELDANPPTIDERLAEARKRLEEALASAEKSKASTQPAEVQAAAQKVAAARAEVNKWRQAQIATELSAARAQVEQLSAANQKVADALKQLEEASQAISHGPARVAEAEQRSAKAKEASASAEKQSQSAQARLKALEPLKAICEEAAKRLKAASEADAQNQALSQAAAKAGESLQLISAEFSAAAQAASAATEAAKQAAAELTAADAQLATAKSQAEQAPRRLEEAKAIIAASLDDRLKEAKSRLDALMEEQSRLASEATNP